MEDVNEVQNVEVVDEGIQYIVVRIGSEPYCSLPIRTKIY